MALVRAHPGLVGARLCLCFAWSGCMTRSYETARLFMVRRRSTVRFRKGAPGCERIAPTPWPRVWLGTASRPMSARSAARTGCGASSRRPAGHTATQGNSPCLSAQYAVPHSSSGADLQAPNTFAPGHGWSFPAAYAQAGCATGCNGGHLRMRAARRR
jgi:hypothetical protein